MRAKEAGQQGWYVVEFEDRISLELIHEIAFTTIRIAPWDVLKGVRPFLSERPPIYGADRL